MTGSTTIGLQALGGLFSKANQQPRVPLSHEQKQTALSLSKVVRSQGTRYAIAARQLADVDHPHKVTKGLSSLSQFFRGDKKLAIAVAATIEPEPELNNPTLLGEAGLSADLQGNLLRLFETPRAGALDLYPPVSAPNLLEDLGYLQQLGILTFVLNPSQTSRSVTPSGHASRSGAGMDAIRYASVSKINKSGIAMTAENIARIRVVLENIQRDPSLQHWLNRIAPATQRVREELWRSHEAMFWNYEFQRHDQGLHLVWFLEDRLNAICIALQFGADSVVDDLYQIAIRTREIIANGVSFLVIANMIMDMPGLEHRPTNEVFALLQSSVQQSQEYTNLSQEEERKLSAQWERFAVPAEGSLPQEQWAPLLDMQGAVSGELGLAFTIKQLASHSIHRPRSMRGIDDMIKQYGDTLPSMGKAIVLGGGMGHEALTLAAHRDRFDTVISIEGSFWPGFYTQRNADRLSPILNLAPIRSWIGDIATYPYEPGSANLIVALHCWEYLSNEQRAVLGPRLKNALKTGGVLWVSVLLGEGTTYANYPFPEIEPGVRLVTDVLPRGVPVTYQQRWYKRGELKREFESYGFMTDQGYNLRLLEAEIPQNKGFSEAQIWIQRKSG